MNQDNAQECLKQLASITETLLDIPTARSDKYHSRVDQAIRSAQLVADKIRQSVTFTPAARPPQPLPPVQEYKG